MCASSCRSVCTITSVLRKVYGLGKSQNTWSPIGTVHSRRHIMGPTTYATRRRRESAVCSLGIQCRFSSDDAARKILNAVRE
ncbi:hypothetical protein HBH45_197220 [Parastagonospora nodorum]|nr:hypothetical protein HBH45_197220 [Parastagonospora nodorum]KAH4573588.1 hypothetical protein HBH83_208730 [Parastagonospora nodorum]